MKVAEVTSIRTSAFGAFKVTRALHVAYVDMDFGVRRSAPDSDRVMLRDSSLDRAAGYGEMVNRFKKERTKPTAIPK